MHESTHLATHKIKKKYTLKGHCHIDRPFSNEKGNILPIPHLSDYLIEVLKPLPTEVLI